MRRRPRYTPTRDPLFPGAYRCEVCDITLDPGHEPDVVRHEREHPRLLEMERWTKRLMSYAEQREIEHESAGVLDSDAPLEQRVVAAEKLLWAYHHRFLRKIAKEGNPRFERHPLEDFIGAANLEGIFARDVAAALRAKYGTVTWPEISMRNWDYRD